MSAGGFGRRGRARPELEYEEAATLTAVEIQDETRRLTRTAA